uniref:Uncharacterized protein n=1 Tax=Nelumbo nucifera TaxID=4432 RepID=A0A822XXV0_NELNU|nr:TPA_asm: hypothetical protein HUJ06_026007 [Nelumbo nucifera]
MMSLQMESCFPPSNRTLFSPSFALSFIFQMLMKMEQQLELTLVTDVDLLYERGMCCTRACITV